MVESLSRPGGNATGFTSIEYTVGAKWLQLLKEVDPRIARVAINYNPQTAPFAGLFLRSVQSAAQSAVEKSGFDATSDQRSDCTVCMSGFTKGACAVRLLSESSLRSVAYLESNSMVASQPRGRNDLGGGVKDSTMAAPVAQGRHV